MLIAKGTVSIIDSQVAKRSTQIPLQAQLLSFMCPGQSLHPNLGLLRQVQLLADGLL